MTPIVFCASLVPCASETSEADPICPQRKPFSRLPTATRAVILNTSQVPLAATSTATTGANTAGSTIEETTPSHLTPPRPRATTAEPIRPPNRAWEEDEGRPSSQVTRFHKMPPTRPANTMVRIGTPIRPGIGSPFDPWIATTLLLTVRATSMLRKAPTRLSAADSTTAVLGFRAPVAIEVAIALAVSWKPLVKSKASAVTTTTARMNSACVTA